MAQARRKTSSSLKFNLLGFIKRSVRETVFLCFAGLALYMLVALVSFNPRDPAWTHTGSGGEVSNLAGAPGAWFADIGLYFFGYLVYLLPLMVVFSGWRLFRRNAWWELDAEIVIFRSMGVVVTLAAGCALASLHLEPIRGAVSAGGVVGDITGRGLVGAFSFAGGALFLLALFIAGITLATGISWLQLLDVIGGFVNGLLQAPAMFRRWLRADAHQPAAPKEINELDEKHEAPQEQPKVSISKPSNTKSIAKVTEAPRGVRIEPVIQDLPEVFVDSQPTIIKFEPEPEPKPKPKLEPRPESKLEPEPETEFAFKHESEAKPELEPDPKPAFAPKPGFASKSESVPPHGMSFAPPSTPAPLPPLPSVDLLDGVPTSQTGYSRETLEAMSRQVETLLRHFGVEVEVVAVEPGPVITRFELDPAPGVKVSQISNLFKDLARGLSVMSVRVVEVIPGKSVVGLEIPNQNRNIVYLSEILNSPAYAKSNFPMTLALGKDIGGKPIVANLAKMPHLLVAGTTGSGKSVAVNAMLLSILYKASPEEVRLILVDPKMLELSVYEGIPHLLAPVVTDMKEAANALRWCVAEMERRYKLMAALKVRNITGFNRKVNEAIAAGEYLPILSIDPRIIWVRMTGFPLWSHCRLSWW